VLPVPVWVTLDRISLRFCYVEDRLVGKSEKKLFSTSSTIFHPHNFRKHQPRKQINNKWVKLISEWRKKLYILLLRDTRGFDPYNKNENREK
jgi:hypothetical protein